MNEIKFTEKGENIESHIECNPMFAAQCIEILLSEFLSNVQDYEGIEKMFLRILDKYKNPANRKLD